MSGAASSVRPSTTITMASACSSATRAWRKISDGNQRLVVGNDAAGIDHAQHLARPFGFAVEAVAGDAGLVADDGAARSDQPVEQRRFADVGAADDGERAGDRQFAAARLAAGFVMDSAAHWTGDSFGGAGSNGYYRDCILSPCLLRHNPRLVRSSARAFPRCTSSSGREECWRAAIPPTSFAAGNCRWRRPWSRRSRRSGT